MVEVSIKKKLELIVQSILIGTDVFVYTGEAAHKLNSASMILLVTCTFGGKN